ncbi:hypothetical protein C0J52_06100 [Blattella germanica]|nr:hypothetical protein C0J52_06100 [Blattella germanica]
MARRNRCASRNGVCPPVSHRILDMSERYAMREALTFDPDAALPPNQQSLTSIQHPKLEECHIRQTKITFGPLIARETGSRRRNNNNSNNAMPSNRGKPTMEIYRPPNVRTDLLQNGVTTNVNPRLNVHAKEFTMKQGDLSTSRSSVNVPSTLNNHRDPHGRSAHHLQQSKSSGNILHSLQHSKSGGNVMHTLQQSSSIGNILQGPRVHFQLDPRDSENQIIEMVSPSMRAPPPVTVKSAVKAYSTADMKATLASDNNFNKSQMMNIVEAPTQVPAEGYTVSGMKSVHIPMTIHTTSLKRSRSLGAADMAARSGLGVAKEAPELGNFPIEVQAIISRAVEERDEGDIPGISSQLVSAVVSGA